MMGKACLFLSISPSFPFLSFIATLFLCHVILHPKVSGNDRERPSLSLRSLRHNVRPQGKDRWRNSDEGRGKRCTILSIPYNSLVSRSLKGEELNGQEVNSFPSGRFLPHALTHCSSPLCLVNGLAKRWETQQRRGSERNGMNWFGA